MKLLEENRGIFMKLDFTNDILYITPKVQIAKALIGLYQNLKHFYKIKHEQLYNSHSG